MSIISYGISKTRSVTIQYKQFIIINYVSEHQLSHAVGASHTAPTTHVNWGRMLLKLIGWRHYTYFRWVSYIPGTTAWVFWRWTGRTAKYLVTVTVISLWKNSGIINSTNGMSVISGNPAVEPSIGCATCILVHPKDRRCLLHQFSQSQCKLYFYIII